MGMIQINMANVTTKSGRGGDREPPRDTRT